MTLVLPWGISFHWQAFFDAILWSAYLVAAVRLIHAAMRGRQAIVLFRWVGVAICLAWAVYYFGLWVDHRWDIINPHQWTHVERGIQFFNVMLFIVWGFLFNESKWTARMTAGD